VSDHSSYNFLEEYKMANKFDLKSKNVVIGSAASTTSFGIGAVPTGKKRFITFIEAVNLHHGAGATNTLYLASNAAASVTTLASATASKKLAVPFRTGEFDDVRQIPEGVPDSDNPLFTIGASNYLVGCASRANVDVFVVYYDD